MSTLQVANVHLESTGNNRIQYTGSNTFTTYAGGASTISVNSTAVGVSSGVNLQVANVHLESTGNNRIQYTGSNTFTTYAGGASTISVNSTAVGVSSGVNLQVANVHLESTGNNRIQYTGSNTVSVYTAGVERMRIDNNGNVGIGTTSPSSTLDVIGTVKFTSANVTSNTLTLGTSSITANGYSRLPNGLLYQWGSIIVTNTTTAFNWPTAFTTVYSVTATSNNIAATASVHVPAFTTSQCTIRSGGTTVLATWMAIGV